MKPSFRRAALLLALAGLALAPAAQATTFSNTGSIDVPDEAAANPWPATISVSGMVGEVTDLEVVLNDVTHTHLDDLGVVAQAPTGQSLLLMNGVGPIVSPSNPLSGVTSVDLTVDDEALVPFANLVVPLTGSHQPANHSGLDNFTSGGTGPGTSYSNPGPTPAGTGTLASTFNGIAPNGTWRLWVRDFAQDDVGEIAGGWALDVTTDGSDNTAPVTTITSGPNGTIGTGSVSFSFTANEPATFECKLDSGAFDSCGSPRHYSGLAEGQHTFTVRATDTSNNVEVSPPNRTFTVDLADPPPPPPPPPPSPPPPAGGDATPPTASITGVKVKRPKRKATVSFAGSDDTTAAGALRFNCALDGKAPASCSSPATYKKLKVGRHTVEVRAFDEAGNRSAPATKSFKVKRPSS